MTKQEEIRVGILHAYLLEGQHCVTFSERIGNTEGLFFQCYPTKAKALTEIHIFENYKLYQALGKV